MAEATTKDEIAPRLGVAHPITDDTQVRLSYGKFYQLPRAAALLLELPDGHPGVGRQQQHPVREPEPRLHRDDGVRSGHHAPDQRQPGAGRGGLQPRSPRRDPSGRLPGALDRPAARRTARVHQRRQRERQGVRHLAEQAVLELLVDEPGVVAAVGARHVVLAAGLGGHGRVRPAVRSAGRPGRAADAADPAAAGGLRPPAQHQLAVHAPVPG